MSKATNRQRKALVMMWEKQTNEEFDTRTYKQWLEDVLADVLWGMD